MRRLPEASLATAMRRPTSMPRKRSGVSTTHRSGAIDFIPTSVIIRGGMRSASCGERPAAAVRGQDLGLLGWRRRNVLRQRLDELLLGVELERRVVASLEAD